MEEIGKKVKVVHHSFQALAFMFNGGFSSFIFYPINTKICMALKKSLNDVGNRCMCLPGWGCPD